MLGSSCLPGDVRNDVRHRFHHHYPIDISWKVAPKGSAALTVPVDAPPSAGGDSRAPSETRSDQAERDTRMPTPGNVVVQGTTGAASSSAPKPAPKRGGVADLEQALGE